jgi:N-acetylmuramoyl-L-alanine amidase
MATALWLADVLRDAGLEIVETAGWQQRGRALTPMGIVVHHTASNPGSDPDGDLAYINVSGPLVPEYNVYVSRSGVAYVCAAGACNHAGVGGPYNTTSGMIPADSANSRTFAVVGANNGIGEQWPARQQDVLVETCAAICRQAGLKSTDVFAHWEWTTRKIDPAGNSLYAAGGAKWDMNRFRADVISVGTAPPVTPLEDTVPYLIILPADGATEGFACYQSGNVRRVGGFELTNLTLAYKIGTLVDSAWATKLAAVSMELYSI